MGLWVAAGRLILPLLEAGDNKLTIFKTSGEQERWLTGRKEESEIDEDTERREGREKERDERKKERKMVFYL